MYENFYNLKEKPFQIVSDPNYLYMSPVHENALTYLEYGLIENVGFILLTGEVGAGKTTLVRHLMGQFQAEKEIGILFNTNVTADELVHLILLSFSLTPQHLNKVANIELFHQFLKQKHTENKHVLLIVDEAQALSNEALEEIRMFSNLQNGDRNLVQIMLVGQPELTEKLQQPCHHAFAQRIAVNFFLSGLSDEETDAYIAHRLKKAGGKPDIFSREAIARICSASGGIPRSINLLCDSALVYGFGYNLETIDTHVIEQVIKDKGGMGIRGEEEKAKEITNNSVQILQNEINELAGLLKDLEQRTCLLEKNGGGDLLDLLSQERQRSDELLGSYSQLKVKYQGLLRAWKDGKKTKRQHLMEMLPFLNSKS